MLRASACGLALRQSPVGECLQTFSKKKTQPGPCLDDDFGPGIGKHQIIFSKGYLRKVQWLLERFIHKDCLPVCVQLKKKTIKDMTTVRWKDNKEKGWCLGSTEKRESEKWGCKMIQTQIILFSSLLPFYPLILLSFCCLPFTICKQKSECKETLVTHFIKVSFQDTEQSRKEQRINIGKVKMVNQHRVRAPNVPRMLWSALSSWRPVFFTVRRFLLLSHSSTASREEARRLELDLSFHEGRHLDWLIQLWVPNT